MAAHMVPQSPEFLTSWKEIATYLGKGVRTVQRWEEQFGLPVRRPNEKVKGIVYATREDLDRWLAKQWTHRGSGLPQAVPANELLESVRAGILRSEALRRANLELLARVRSSVNTVFQECRTMARNMTPTVAPPRDVDNSSG